jgi:hypothetical protein
MAKFHLIGAAALLLAGVQGAAAATYTLDFNGSICNGGNACSNGSRIDQSYGDVAGMVDVTTTSDRNNASAMGIYFWATGYESLVNVAYGDLSAGGIGITFAAAAGKEVTINGFDIAPYLDRQRNSRVQVIDGATNTTLFDSGSFAVSTAGITSYSNAGDWTSSLISILLGPDAWDVGIDNISYTVSDATGGVNPVPLPAAAWLLLGGLGALGAVARRRS